MSNANPWADVARMAAQSQLFQMSPSAGDAYHPVPEGFMKNLQQPSGGSKVMNALGYLGAAAGNLRQGGLVGALGGLADRYNQRQFMKSYSAQQQAMMMQQMAEEQKNQNAYTAIEQQHGLPQGSLSKGTFDAFDNMMKYQGFSDFNKGNQELTRGDTPSDIDFGYANPAQTSGVYTGVMDRFGAIADEQERRRQYEQGMAMQGAMDQGGSIMPNGTPTGATNAPKQRQLTGGVHRTDLFDQNPYGLAAAGVDYRDKGVGRNQDQQGINEAGRHNKQEEQLKQAVHQATVNNQGGYARYAPSGGSGFHGTEAERALNAGLISEDQYVQHLTRGGEGPPMNAAMMSQFGEMEADYNRLLETNEGGWLGIGRNVVTKEEAEQAEAIRRKHNSQAAKFGYPLLGSPQSKIQTESPSTAKIKAANHYLEGLR